MKHRYDCIDALRAAGINYEDACALRRISMALHRWHELECGDDNGYASFCLTRGKQQPEGFVYDDDAKPFMEVHPNNGSATRYTAIPDREHGALKRLAAIMARYPGFASYVQSDPRGCALYILRPGDMPATDPNCAYSDHDISSYYSRGIAVHK